MTRRKPTAVVYDDVYKQHAPEGNAPEFAARCDAVMAALRGAAFDPPLAELPPRLAAEDELLLCHDREYVDLVRRDAVAGRTV